MPRPALALIALGLLSCGDATVDGAYRGDPIAQFPALARFAAEMLPRFRPAPGGEVRVAIFWSPLDGDFAALDRLEEDPDTGTVAVVGHTFVLSLFDRPSALRLGRVLAYRDDDGDGHYGPDEVLVGAAQGEGVIYARTALGAEDSPTGNPLAAGYHAVLLPLPAACGLSPPPVEGPPCDVPLGARCADDDACGDGICLRSDVLWWPEGACVAPLGPDLGCTPDGAWLPARGGPGYMVRRCDGDADCPRAGYGCDRGIGGCVPNGPLSLLVGYAPTGSVLCPAPQGDALEIQRMAPPPP